MNPVTNRKNKNRDCLEKNVHVLKWMDTDGQKACPSASKSALRKASNQNVQAHPRFMSICFEKCPSAPLKLDVFIMDDMTELFWKICKTGGQHEC